MKPDFTWGIRGAEKHMQNLSPGSAVSRRLGAAGPLMIPGVFKSVRGENRRTNRLSCGLSLWRCSLREQRCARHWPTDAYRICAGGRSPPHKLPLCPCCAMRIPDSVKPLNVERTVRQLEAAGAAGIHLEDQEMPKRCGHLSGKSVVSAEAQWPRRFGAAVAAKRDKDFVIIAHRRKRGKRFR